MKIAVFGAGSWGTALAVSLASGGHSVGIWDINAEHLAQMEQERENSRYLPGVKLPAGISIKKTPEEVLSQVELVVFSAPAQHFRSALTQAKPFLTKDMVLVNVAKGIEQKTLLRLSQIALELAPGANYVALSGPSHAEEVGQGLPTTLVAACANPSFAELVQDVFMSKRLRVYTNTDLVGVELGGALKNIIALGAGISDGMGFGDNAKAALMTRGLTEIARLGIELGALESTFAGLTGVGDLIVTCTSMHSRNRRCGIMIGEGMKPEDAIQRVGMVVEGVYTTEAAYQLAKKLGVEMPITEKIYQAIQGELNARDAVTQLMSREKKHETEESLLRSGE